MPHLITHLLPQQHILAQAEAVCETRGVRLTPLRRAVFEIILTEDGPLGAYGVMERLARNRNRRVAPPTVYRALEFLVEQGLICRIESVHGYIAVSDPGAKHPRAYLLCAQCGALAEMAVPEIETALDDKARALGFHAVRQVVELQGTCATCLEAKKPDED